MLSVSGTVLVFCLVAGLWPLGLELSFQPVNGDAPVLVLPLEPMERFTLHYIHSVDRTPVWEVHSVGTDGTIYVEEERFVMFGAGMGHWNGHGTLTTRGSYQVIENLHEPLRNFVLRVGSQSSPHSIIWRGTRINLSNHFPGRAMNIAAEQLNIAKLIWRKIVRLTNIPVTGESA